MPFTVIKLANKTLIYFDELCMLQIYKNYYLNEVTLKLFI